MQGARTRCCVEALERRLWLAGTAGQLDALHDSDDGRVVSPALQQEAALARLQLQWRRVAECAPPRRARRAPPCPTTRRLPLPWRALRRATPIAHAAAPLGARRRQRPQSELRRRKRRSVTAPPAPAGVRARPSDAPAAAPPPAPTLRRATHQSSLMC